VISLAQKARVILTSPLYIPPGFTLTTDGQPALSRYALMARLVRSPAFPPGQPTLVLGAGARTTNVWVDGRGTRGVNIANGGENVRLLGGPGTTELTGSRLSNTAGFVSVMLFGAFQGQFCQGARVTGNLLTAYNGFFDAGIQSSCENAVIEANQIVDVGDAAITLFPGRLAPQASQVRRNTIVSAGRNAAFGIFADPPSPTATSASASSTAEPATA
jgi:hypothetical protein